MIKTTQDELREIRDKFATYLKLRMGGRQVGGAELDENEVILAIEAYRDNAVREARLNELKHIADDAVQRMYCIDRVFAGKYIEEMREFYPIQAERNNLKSQEK